MYEVILTVADYSFQLQHDEDLSFEEAQAIVSKLEADLITDGPLDGFVSLEIVS